MTTGQFARLANEYAAQPDDVRRTIESLACGDVAAAADHAGGRFTDTWWSAEFFVRRLADHGLTDAPKFTPAEPRRRAQRGLFSE